MQVDELRYSPAFAGTLATDDLALLVGSLAAVPDVLVALLSVCMAQKPLNPFKERDTARQLNRRHPKSHGQG